MKQHPEHVDSGELDTIPQIPIDPPDPISQVRRRAVAPTQAKEELNGVTLGLFLTAWSVLVALAAVLWAVFLR